MPHKLVCTLCDKILKEFIHAEDKDLAISIADRHQHFHNEYTDDRCINRDINIWLNNTFEIIKYKKQEWRKLIN